MEQRVSVITLGVADIARARQFYETGLGWQSVAAHDDVVFFQLPTLVFSLFARAELEKDAQHPTGSGWSGIALAHNTRDRDGVDAVLAQAGAAGARILRPAQDTFWGGYAGYFADPDGHVWEVAWNPHWPIERNGAVRIPQT